MNHPMIHACGARMRRQMGGDNALLFDERYAVTMIRKQYRTLRRQGVYSEAARYALWTAAWMGTMHHAKFIGKSDAFPALDEVAP